MKRLLNKRTLLIVAGIVVVVGLLTATFSYSLRHKSNLNYEDEVKAALSGIEAVSKELVEIDVNEDGKALLKAYDKIIGIADDALKLQAPDTWKDFDVSFKSYMEGTREGYTLIRIGTDTDDVEKIAEGIKILSGLDDSFVDTMKIEP